MIEKTLHGTWDTSWKYFFSQLEHSQDYLRLMRALEHDYQAGYTIYPEQKNIFRAFSLTAAPAVRVVILGQDPYHTPGAAEGLAFSVPEGYPIPGSLRNLYKELIRDLHISPPHHGHLGAWAKNGVLLLNTALTVRHGMAHSHRHIGWAYVIQEALLYISRHQQHCVFMLWGAQAQTYSSFITATEHLILSSAHPSPLSAHRGFIGNGHFSQCNAYLQQHQLPAIDWSVADRVRS